MPAQTVQNKYKKIAKRPVTKEYKESSIDPTWENSSLIISK